MCRRALLVLSGRALVRICGVLLYVAVCSSVLQWVAVCCSAVLLVVSGVFGESHMMSQLLGAVCCSVLQCVAKCCKST